MAIKTPIISIDIDDGAFQRFAALFARYQAQLKQMPGQWREVGEEANAVLDKVVDGSEAVAEALDGATDSVHDIGESLVKVVEEADGISESTERTATNAATTAVSFRQTYIAVNAVAQQVDRVSAVSREAAVSTRSQAAAWHDMARSARSFAGQIGDATRSLLRWTGLTGVISSILGVGGLFGIDRLAGHAGNARKSALGLDVTPGEQSAFGINYGRVLDDPSSFLSGVNDTLIDITKRHQLYGAGLREGDLTGKDTAQVAADLIPALKRLADQTPKALLESVRTSRDLPISKNDFERLKGMSPGEVAAIGSRFQQDAKGLNLDQQQLIAWQNLQVQISRAGASIERTFITNLTPLAPQLEKLSTAFTKAVGDLLSAPQMKQWIEDLAGGIKWLADTMLDDKFRDKIHAFIKGVGEFATAIGDAITAIEGFIAWFRGDAAGDIVKNGGVNGTLGDNEGSPGSNAFNRKRHPEQYNEDGTPKEKPPEANWLNRWIYRRNAGPDSSPDAHTEEYQKLERDNNLPAGTLKSVERQESGFKDVMSDAGAQGYFEFMPATAKDYHVNPHDEISSATGAAHYFRKLLDEFHGDIAKAAAGYNWGEGKVEEDIKQYGDKWREHLPPETANYVNSITTQIANNTTNNHGGGGRHEIIIQNNTGGNATVSASQLVN